MTTEDEIEKIIISLTQSYRSSVMHGKLIGNELVNFLENKI